ncbi:MAG: hypothetical protein IJI07_12265 [Flexilinea sp.]|nr:hypothetical protein [Flexilinea sp.]
MRENEKKMNMADDQKNIHTPVWIAAAVFVLLAGFLAWLAVRKPEAVSGVRDLLITLFVFLLFVIGIVLTVLMIILSSRIDGAKVKIDEVLSKADGKTEELADKITEILRSILNPFIEAKSRNSGVKHLFSKKDAEE